MDELESAALDTVIVLPQGVSGDDVADAAREAALGFVNGSKGWTKRELSTWLAGTFASLTMHTRRDDDAPPAWPIPPLQDVDPRLVRRIVESARTEVLEALARVVKDGAAPFMLRMLIAGFVVRCRDGLGAPAWLPTGASVRLADRVLSLFAVDYLAWPDDYESGLAVCSLCGEVVFDENVRRRKVCDRHVESSLLSVRGAATSFPPPGA